MLDERCAVAALQAFQCIGSDGVCGGHQFFVPAGIGGEELFYPFHSISAINRVYTKLIKKSELEIDERLKVGGDELIYDEDDGNDRQDHYR